MRSGGIIFSAREMEVRSIGGPGRGGFETVSRSIILHSTLQLCVLSR